MLLMMSSRIFVLLMILNRIVMILVMLNMIVCDLGNVDYDFYDSEECE